MNHRLVWRRLICVSRGGRVVTVDYYWIKAEEALAKADAHKLLGNYYVAVALAYRLLAFSEAKFRNSGPLRKRAIPDSAPSPGAIDPD